MKKMLVTAVAAVGLSLAWFSPAQAQSFANWSSGTVTTGDAMYAITINDSGNALGQYCFPASESCVWLLAMSTTCDEGDQYPVLANSDVGAAYLQVYCSRKLDNGLQGYAFTQFDAVNAIVTKGSTVGFAIPLKGDQFRVVRFSLAGSNRAISTMRAEAQRAQKILPPKYTGTRDIDL